MVDFFFKCALTFALQGVLYAYLAERLPHWVTEYTPVNGDHLSMAAWASGGLAAFSILALIWVA